MPDHNQPQNVSPFAKLLQRQREAAQKPMAAGAPKQAQPAPVPASVHAPIEQIAAEPAPKVDVTAEVASEAASESTQTALAVLEPAQPTSQQVAVLLSAGSPRASAVLAGTTGTMQDGKFVPDEDYKRLSYLFTLTPRGGLPIDPTQDAVMQMNISAGDAQALRANLIQSAAKNWESLYEMAGSPGAASTLLRNERASVADNVRRYLSEQGLATYAVPVIYGAHVGEEDPAQRDHSEEGLLRTARPDIGSMTIDTTREVTRPAFAQLPAAGQEPLPMPPAAITTQGGQVAGANHHGALSLNVEGAVYVLAHDPQQAIRMTQCIQAIVRQTSIMQNVLTLRPESIQNVTMLEPTPSDEGDGYERRGYY